jgi:DNA-binding transcriptional LysR family regulator
MDMHKLKCVVSLARLKNVTRAAEENYIAQPTMTSTITAVESELGVKLFTRSQRAVTTTPAGESFAVAAEAIIEQYSSAVAEARRLDAQKCISTEITIGFTNLSLGSSTKPFLTAISEQYPEMNIRLYKSTLSNLTKSLCDGRADIIFSNQFEIRGRCELNYIPLVETTPCAFLHRLHPLANKEILTIEDLEGERLLCACAADDLKHLSAAALVLRNAGVPFTEDSPIDGEEAIVSMVEAGLGIYPAAAQYRHAFTEDVVCLPLAIDAEHMLIVIAWRNAEYEAFASAIASLANDALAQ